jgi:hypothetical protein
MVSVLHKCTLLVLTLHHSNSPSYELYPVCSFRARAAEACCTNPVKGYQCWSFCAVAEADFETWFSCARKLNATTRSGGLEARCQRADQSPLLTEKGPYPQSYSQPRAPESYHSYLASQNSQPRASGSLGARDAGPADATATPTSSTTAVKNAATSTHSATATPTGKSGSTKALELSIASLLYAFLVLSTLIL